MKRDLTTKIIAVAALVCVVLASGDALGVVIDKIVAVVNGEVITQREVTWLLIPIYEEYKGEYTGKRLEVKMVEAEDNILNQLIEDKLVLSEAKRLDIKVSDEEIEGKLDAVRSKFGTEEEFRDVMARQNVTLSELRERFKSDLIKSKLVRQKVGWGATITPSEVREYYDAHKEEFMSPEKVRAFNILIKKRGDKQVKGEAIFILEKIKESLDKGKNFEELAKEYSEGPNADGGGGLGLVERGQMIKEIDDVIFSIGEGEVSDIIESPLGHHLFKVTEKIPANVIEFEIAKDEIEELIYRNKIDKNLTKWMRELRKHAYISIK